jgi:adenylosuccinate lyase
MIELANKGMGRQEAHELMRKSAIEAREAGLPLVEVLAGKKEVARFIKKGELQGLFDASEYIGESERIVEDAIKDSGK